jgi:hypothetical protein
MTSNKEQHDMSVYVGDEAIPFRDALKDVLVDIDWNISKLISKLIPSALEQAKKIRDAGDSHYHYEWRVITKRRKRKEKKNAVSTT